MSILTDDDKTTALTWAIMSTISLPLTYWVIKTHFNPNSVMLILGIVLFLAQIGCIIYPIKNWKNLKD